MKKVDFTIQKDAVISDCGKYRYSLSRIWDDSKPKVMFIMLNPSTADAEKDDPTIRRCIRFANDWGYGGLHVCNIFAYRARNPQELLNVDDPVGKENVWITRNLVNEVEIVVNAWGNDAILNKFENISTFLRLFFCNDKQHYLELTKRGTPKHPLYLKSNLRPIKAYT